MCKHWIKGNCAYGDICAFQHGRSHQPVPFEAGAGSPMRDKEWAHIFLFHQDYTFALVPWLIGTKGSNTRAIFEATQCKVRIRGRGSGHLEVDGTREAPVPLMMAVTGPKQKPRRFVKAVHLAVELLERAFRSEIFEPGSSLYLTVQARLYIYIYIYMSRGLASRPPE